MIHLTGRMVINSPKTVAGNRQITLNHKLADELHQWKNKQKELLSPFLSDTEKLQVFQFVPSLLPRYMVTKKYDKLMERSSTLKKSESTNSDTPMWALLINNDDDPYTNKERI